MSDHLFWFAVGDENKMREELAKSDRKELERMLFNERYNDFCRQYSDCKDDDEDKDEVLNGKRVPYMGWFWRGVDFFNYLIPIGFHEGYVAFMENNKWDYHERNMSRDEAKQVMVFLDAAYKANRAGGELSGIIKNTHTELKKLRDWMQTLPR